MAGEETVLPGSRAMRVAASIGTAAVLPGSRAMRVAASIGTAGDAALRVLKAEERDAIEEVLSRCAEDARSTVLLERFHGRNPTPEECKEVVDRDAHGQPIT
ncbi:putative lipoprotein [Corallococcus macrosporus]|uniref:Putative lipoprotein n=2 Tax=Myxococcaceae TaxID=31 RepID=F8CFQ7_MYXFH|nr:putative lipoprotein [Corallococcus macrosporus]